MGGLGSGRPSGGGKTGVEECLRLDVNQLNRRGALACGWRGSWSWSAGARSVGSINIDGGHDRITLRYRSRVGASDWESIVETVAIQWRQCRFGGQRPFFICPATKNSRGCRRSTQMLICAGRYYLCRQCCRLAYGSQGECRSDRAIRRLIKIRTRLGGDNGIDDPLPEKPKGMWARTYDRFVRQAEPLELASMERLEQMVARLNPRTDATRATPRSRKKGHFAP